MLLLMGVRLDTKAHRLFGIVVVRILLGVWKSEIDDSLIAELRSPGRMEYCFYHIGSCKM